ncbi:MAG: helix-turn-helix transcriptional regulator [Bacteroidota bacterium]
MSLKKQSQSKNKNSWLNYLSTSQEEVFDEQNLNALIPGDIFNLNYLNHPLFSHAIPWIYLLDYTTGRYLMTSNGVQFMLGYKPEYFTNGRIEAVMHIFDRDHLRLFNEEIFPDRLKLLKSIPANEHHNYIFNYNLKLHDSKGRPVNLLQRNCFIKSDTQGNPLLSYGIITNINHYIDEAPVIQVVEKINDAGCGGSDIIAKKHYYFNGEDRLFTKREKELLLWLSDGLSSKEIAGKLYISEHTVINHKRSMMKKCNANNSAELVAFGIRNQLL